MSVSMRVGRLDASLTASSIAGERGRRDAELVARFASGGRDAAEEAFRTLVDRHGPMVWGVCRRVLADRHEAEDAFQATFLLLARKAPRIRRPELLGNWLYGVAYKVSARARSGAALRRLREHRGAEMVASLGARDNIDGDLGAILHAEIGRLPEIYRAPVVLCYLEGMTNEEAARALRCPVGTVKVRLMRARQRLRSRLERRGMAPALLLLFAFVQDDANAAVPVEVVEDTIDLGMGARAARGPLGSRSRHFRRFGWAALILLLLIAAAAAVSAVEGGRKRPRRSIAPPPIAAPPPQDTPAAPVPDAGPPASTCHH